LSLILIVDDEPQILDLLHAILTFEGHDVIKAKDGREAISLMHKDIGLVITDLIMPDKEGLATISELRRQGFLQPIMAMTAGGLIGPHDYLAAARARGANAVLAKPFSREEVLVPLRALLAAGGSVSGLPWSERTRQGQSVPPTMSA